MMAPLRIGFAGANAERGWARDAHLAAVRAIPALTIAAVSARTPALAQAAAAVFGAPRAFGDSLAMARDPDIDIVAVTVKVPEHRAIILAALAAGKHVYSEWPLGRDLAEAAELAAAAAAAGTHVMIGTQGRTAPAVRHAAALVAQGAIGRLLSLRVVSPTQGWGPVAPPFYAYLQDKAHGATLATIAGGHTLAMIEAVVGAYVDLAALDSILIPQVAIMGAGTGAGGQVTRTCADHMLVIGRHASGCVSSLEVLGNAAMPLRFELTGSTGTLTITGHHAGGFQVGELGVATTPPSPPPPPRAVPGVTGASINVAEMWALFAADLRGGTRTVPDFADAVRLTRLLDTIEAAAATGHRTTVNG